MKQFIIGAILTLTTAVAMAQAPAFPGAEGHGRYTTGGRGGNVIHVTNLNDSGTGSLRAAVEGNSKKIIVFDVGGVISLNSELKIGGNTTIEGQTAPYPGITLRYYTVRPGANNIIRFLRIRRGSEKDVNDGADAIWQREVTSIMLDHCSFSWSIDEVASFYDNNNFTMQWCTIGESLNNAGHQKEAHGYGGIWGGKLASFHHNMLIHLQNRTPRFNGSRYGWDGWTNNKEYSTYQWENTVQAENVDFRNCVLYDWGTGGCYGGPGGGQINMVNNYYKAGPATRNKTRLTQVSVSNSGNSTTDTFEGMTSRYYISGNYMAAATSPENYDWKGVVYDSGVFTINGEKYSQDPNNYYGNSVPHVNNSSGVSCVRIKMDTPTATGLVTTHNATTAYEKVLDYVGASMYRDNVDERYVKETRNGTATYTGSITGLPGIVDLVSDVNGYTEANFGTGSLPSGWDTDNDGMPDIWETANGLNPNSAADATTYTLDTKGYYTNIEVYCNALVEDLVKLQNADAQNSFDEYYPEVVRVEGIPYYGYDPNGGDDPELGDMEYVISNSTNTGNNTSSTYEFENGITVTNVKNKSYGAGMENGVKYSAGVQYTINLPEGFKVLSIKFKGYDNYADADSYIQECNGTEYSSTQYVFPQKNGSSYVLTEHQINFDTPATGQITFTPAGKQVVWVITLCGTYKSDDSMSYTIAQSTNTGSNTTSTYEFENGITVTNVKEKSYSVGFEDGIKYSAGVQYTIHLPEGFKANNIIFKGYDNYADADSYIKECNGKEYGTTEYVYPKKENNNYVVTEHQIDFEVPVGKTITFTPAGKQVVWVITINGIIGGEEEGLLGDANEDGSVSVSDVTVVVNYILGFDTNVINLKNADVNKDNTIGVADVMGIVDIILVQ